MLPRMSRTIAHRKPVGRGGQGMARPTELGLTLEGSEAEEFCKNEAKTVFTSEQLAFFRQAKKIYRASRSKF